MKRLLLMSALLVACSALVAQGNFDLQGWPSTESIPEEPLIHRIWATPPADSLIMDQQVDGPWTVVVRDDTTWLAGPSASGAWDAYSLSLNFQESNCFCVSYWENISHSCKDCWSWTVCEAFSHTSVFEQYATKIIDREYWVFGDTPRRLLVTQETNIQTIRTHDEDNPDEILTYEETMLVWNEVSDSTWKQHMAYFTADTLTPEWVVTRQRTPEGWSEGTAARGRTFSNQNALKKAFPESSWPDCKWWFEADFWVPRD